jgi:hypothetical protein
LLFSVQSKRLSSSSAFLQSITQLTLADRPQPVSSSHGLSAPSALAGIEGPPVRGFASSASLRLQGLVTLLTAYSLRNLGGSVSRRQHSWGSPFGACPPARYPRRFRLGWTHLPFLLPLFPSAEAQGRPDRPRFLGLDPARRPDRPPVGLALTPPGNSRGLFPSRVFRKSLDRDFARSPLTCFADGAANGFAGRHPRVSIDFCLTSPLNQSYL